MKTKTTALAVASLVLLLAGCGGNYAQTPDEIAEIAEARDACNEAGGLFVQWSTDFGQRWRCDFDQREDSNR
ncbi:hypothetical protein [Microcella sp.]|uniref:hypothetical protein n=1 Tax=Microcella sp. TaxID=1913979 RepID=UPI00391C56B2